MSNTYTPNTAPPGSSAAGGPSGSSPREGAARIGDEAASAGHRVADVSKDEAAKVASEAKRQASDVLTEARTQLSVQAAQQQARVASGLRSISDELNEMARSTDEADGGGVANDLVQQAAQRAGSVATWLDARDPGSLLQEVREFARRKPGTFIALAATAGVLAGRLTRSVVSTDSDAGQVASQRRDTSLNAESGRPAPRPASNLATSSLGSGTSYNGVDRLGNDR